MKLKDKRIQFNSKPFKAMLREYRPLVSCCNCGADHALVWHHVVPLAQGGENILSNIVVVCEQCHRAIHGEKHRLAYKVKACSGRKPIRPEGWEEIVRQYIHGEIGKAECEKRLGIKGKLNDCGVIKAYTKKHGIVGFRNNIDLINVKNKHGVQPGRVVGYIRYNDGTEATVISPENVGLPNN